jgi:YafQ family addiction module toxin component
LKIVIKKLVEGKKLEPKYSDHPLPGNWKGHRDCHIGSDWILIYRIEDENLILERTGSALLLSRFPLPAQLLSSQLASQLCCLYPLTFSLSPCPSEH